MNTYDEDFRKTATSNIIITKAGKYNKTVDMEKDDKYVRSNYLQKKEQGPYYYQN